MSDAQVRILLVEDSPSDIYLFQKALVESGLDVELTAIEDGSEALAFIRAEGKHVGRSVPNLAVLDLNLPKNHGLSLLAAIRERAEFSDVPIVVTSSLPAPRDPAPLQGLGVETYITKPSDLEEFMKIGPLLKEVLRAGKTRRN
jgi:CheY-like chemotaxis protein